ncbi:MAG: hypothetical protein NTY22_05850 [Proteobacteria bacterium]|nr:hypothetical protein [Pseudomonadota bacterium]
MHKNFGKFANANNWTPELVDLFADREEFGKYCYVDNNNIIQLKPCGVTDLGQITDDYHQKRASLYEILYGKKIYLETRVMKKIGNDYDRGYSMFIGAGALDPALFEYYPDNITIITKKYSDPALLEEEIKLRTIEILTQSKLVYETKMKWVDLHEVMAVYLTIIEPNKKVGDCFRAYIAMMDLLTSNNHDTKTFSSYGAVFKKMIWPETNGVPPFRGKKIQDYFMDFNNSSISN